MKKLIIALFAAGTLATLAMSEDAGPQSPVVAGGGGFKIQRLTRIPPCRSEPASRICSSA
jgi:hypothetical protein